MTCPIRTDPALWRGAAPSVNCERRSAAAARNSSASWKAAARHETVNPKTPGNYPPLSPPTPHFPPQTPDELMTRCRNQPACGLRPAAQQTNQKQKKGFALLCWWWNFKAVCTWNHYFYWHFFLLHWFTSVSVQFKFSEVCLLVSDRNIQTCWFLFAAARITHKQNWDFEETKL